MNKKPAILIEVSGGVVQNIESTIDVDIYLLDYDNLKENRLLTIIPHSPYTTKSRKELEEEVKKNLLDFLK